jgi:hypothetical protein
MAHVYFSVASGRALHANLLAVVLRYPMSFFDTYVSLLPFCGGGFHCRPSVFIECALMC